MNNFEHRSKYSIDPHHVCKQQEKLLRQKITSLTEQVSTLKAQLAIQVEQNAQALRERRL